MKGKQKLNLMVTEKMHALKPIKARAETEHNGHWKNTWLKTDESTTETEHNSYWRNAWYKKPMNYKLKLNIMVTEIILA